MAWDTAATRRRLLDAGARQFSLHGFAGAHMEAIGRDAQVNKERIYQYFGNKRAFFDAVLADRLGGLFHDAGPVGSGVEGVAEYAGALFDQLVDAPDLARLLAWESLELPSAADAARRAASCAAKVDELRASLPGSTREGAAHLLLSLVTLTVGWLTLARVGEMILPSSPAVSRRARISDQAVAMAQAMTREI